MQQTQLLRALLLAPLLLASIACAEDDATSSSQQSGNQAGSGNDAPDGPVYVLMTQVYTGDDRIVYLNLTNTVDIEVSELSLDDAYEYPSVANFAAVGGKLYVSDGEAPEITQYEVTPSLELVAGDTLNFSAYPFEDNANWHYHYIVDETKVVLPFDVTSRIVWNPEEMAIDHVVEDSAIPLEQDGLTTASDGNRSATRFPSGPVMQPFSTSDANYFYGPSSYIAIYDDQLAETKVLTAPCAGLERVTVAEDGTRYVSSQWNSPLPHLYGDAAAPCAVRVSADGELDEAWTTDFTDQTDGHYVMNYRYLRGGKAIGNVVFHEELGADFSGAFDPDVDAKLWDGGHVRPWLFDVESGTAKEIEGIDVPLTAVLQTEVIDDRIFLFAVFPDYGSTRVYEVSDDAVATAMFDVPGDVYKWERLR